MFVGPQGMQVYGHSPKRNTPETVTKTSRLRGSMTKLQFLGSLVEDANRKKKAESASKIKGILKNAASMPNLANENEQHKIGNKHWRNAIKRQRFLSKNTNVDSSVKKTVKFNDPFGRLNQLDSKYKLCSDDTEEPTSPRREKTIPQLSLRRSQSDDKHDPSNVFITVVYDLKLKEGKLSNEKNTFSLNDACKVEFSSDNDNFDSRYLEQQNDISSDACAKAVQTQLTPFSSTTATAQSSERQKNISVDDLSSNKTTSIEDPSGAKQTATKSKDGVVVTRSRAKPVMFTRCVNNSVPVIADEPVHITTNFCDEEKTSHIMQWLNDVKSEQEREGFCKLLISDGEHKY